MSSNGSADTFLPRAFLAFRNLLLVAGITATLCVFPLSVQAGDATERHTAGLGIPPLDTIRVASGLQWPVFATYAPGDFSRLFIIEKAGRIRILNLETGVLLATPFLNINSLVGGGNSTNDERGLLGLAFHPDYQNNGFFYVDYTNNNCGGGSCDTVIARYSVSGNPDIADAGSGATLLGILQPFSNHNGGWIGFGPNDGYLYIATGDGGSGCDPSQRAQDITNQLLGKMLRIDVDGAFPFAIPPTNPFVGVTGDDEIWAYGLRNPWRPSFDRDTGDLYIADVGQFAWEEVDYQPSSSTGGENYGWDCTEGNACPAPGCAAGACTCGSAALTSPIHVYSSGGGHCSITGGYVYRGCAIPSLSGHYFFGDFCSAQIWTFKVVGGSVTEFMDRTAELAPGGGLSINWISSFGEDALGEIYICDQNGGEVFKIRPQAVDSRDDCNENHVHDACDIASGNSPDDNGNGIPDECEGPMCGDCPTDSSGDGNTGAADLAALLACWGPVVPGCECFDADGDGNIGAFDLASLLAIWGPCP